MKSYPRIAYKQLNPSLYHYPKISSVSGQPVDWRGVHKTVSAPVRLATAENTLEVSGLPMGKTPEYMQERLRRFFAKFGPVTACRALNHPLDPYQCSGIAYVSFRDLASSEAASKAVLKLGTRSMGFKVLSLRLVGEDEPSSGPSSVASRLESSETFIAETRDLYMSLLSEGRQIEEISEKILEKSKSLFFISDDGMVYARKLVDLDRHLSDLSLSLKQEVEASLSQHWRVNAPIKELPEYTKRRIAMWDKKDKLPFDLQILSRDFRQHRIHDEKFLIESKTKRERAQARAVNRKSGIIARSRVSVCE